MPRTAGYYAREESGSPWTRAVQRSRDATPTAWGVRDIVTQRWVTMGELRMGRRDRSHMAARLATAEQAAVAMALADMAAPRYVVQGMFS